MDRHPRATPRLGAVRKRSPTRVRALVASDRPVERTDRCPGCVSRAASALRILPSRRNSARREASRPVGLLTRRDALPTYLAFQPRKVGLCRRRTNFRPNRVGARPFRHRRLNALRALQLHGLEASGRKRSRSRSRSARLRSSREQSDAHAARLQPKPRDGLSRPRAEVADLAEQRVLHAVRATEQMKRAPSLRGPGARGLEDFELPTRGRSARSRSSCSTCWSGCCRGTSIGSTTIRPS